MSFQIAIPDSLLHENYAWVDERLAEMYHIYALTDLNYDEYETAGVIKENWDWVDKRLNEMCEISEHSLIHLTCPPPEPWTTPVSLIWDGYMPGSILNRIEDESSDTFSQEISRIINRLGCQTPVIQGKNNIYDNTLVIENYDEDCDLKTEATFISDYDDETVIMPYDEDCDAKTDATFISEDDTLIFSDEECASVATRIEEITPFAWVQSVFNKRPPSVYCNSPTSKNTFMW